MTGTDQKRNIYIDAMKGLAIIAVVLYHFGGNVLPYGYLGVDVFFVLGGFLLIRQLNAQFEKGEFGYFRFLLKKLLRLWPLVLLAVIVSMLAGAFLMLPNDYENLAESAVASSVFANNVLQCITTKNYWDIVNLYKPLMHLWYVGVLMQAYAVLPLLYLAVVKILKNVRKAMAFVTVALSVLSLIFYLIPAFSSAWKFYYLPFRIFELTLGGIPALYGCKLGEKGKKAASIVSAVLIAVMLSMRWQIGSQSTMVLITASLSAAFLFFTEKLEFGAVVRKAASVLAFLGKRSYSIYIWHQVIIAFAFYSVFADQSVYAFLAIAAATAVVSLLSYRFLEQPIGKAIRNRKEKTALFAASLATAAAAAAVSFFIYRQAGVVRDVPELGIEKSEAHLGMHSEYCDRVYRWDRAFTEDNNTKVLVIGNSFGRDFANILYESGLDLDVTFLYYSEDAIREKSDRIERADRVFYALGLQYGPVPQPVVDAVDPAKLYVVSNKNYGTSNGIVYAKRGTESYYDSTVEYPELLKADNETNKSAWNERFIDLMAPVLDENGRISVFTDDRKLISQDCRHLTEYGAKFYARRLDLTKILNNGH